MSHQKSQHPTQQQLADFALGRGGVEVVDAVSVHIESCEECCQALAQVTDDEVVRLARTVMRTAETPAASSNDTASDSLTMTENGLDPVYAEVADGRIAAALKDHPRYRILERIGSGGMGDVYKAEHRMMGRMVALKVIRSQFMNSPTAVSRFRNEVRTAAKLSHPNIVTSFDAEHVGAIHFLVMEFVEGESLHQYVSRSGSLSTAKAIDVIRQVVAGLEHAFEHGMVHRDIKPQNLMMDSTGRVRILDFGLARLIHDDSDNASNGVSVGITEEHRALGTPDYISPEQASDARACDHRSDIYSLGCTLYFLLSGHPPFPEGNAIEKMSSHLQLRPRPITELRHDVPSSVATLLNRMLARSPDERFQSPTELQHAIDQLNLTGQQVQSSQVHRRSVLGLIACSLAGVAVFGVWQVSNRSRSGAREENSSREDFGVPGESDHRFKALFILPNSLAYPDFAPVRDVLLSAGVEISTTAMRRQVVSNGVEDQPPFDVDYLLSEVGSEQFDAVIVVGGEMEDLTNEGDGFAAVTRIAERTRQQDGVLAAICLGLTVLSDTGHLSGHKVVYSGFIQHEFQMERATPVQELVHADGKLVTAEGPEVAREFAEAILAVLKKP